MRRVVVAGVVLWFGRWLARELASYAGQRVLPRGPAAKDSPRRPGLMPGPYA